MSVPALGTITAPPAVVVAAAIQRGEATILRLLDRLPWFRGAADWTSWRAFLCAVYGLPMSERELAIYRQCTLRKDPPTSKVSEAWMLVGRRGRKSAILATIGVYECVFRDHAAYLAPGEVARVPIMSKTKADAQQIHRYAAAMMQATGLRWLLAKEPTDGGEDIYLTNRSEMVITAARIMGGRGFSTPCALLDEQAYWPTEDSAEPDLEVLRGIKPSQANVPQAIVVGASSLYTRRGLLYTKYRDHYGQDGSILVWKANTLLMHDTPVIRAYVQTAWDEDPIAAAAEVGGLEPGTDIDFRTDVETYVPVEVIDACTDAGTHEREPVRGIRYVAFTDPSGGSGDGFALAIAHYDQRTGCAVLDFLREERAPFQPDVVARSFCADLKRYRLHAVTGDRYGGDWPAAAFQDGAHDETCPRVRDRKATCACEPWTVGYEAAEDTASGLYLEALPILRSSRVRLLDDKRLRAQLQSLQRKSLAGGDKVIHPPGSHDDVANAAAGALVLAYRLRLNIDLSPPPPEPTTLEEAETQRLWKGVRKRVKEYVRREQRRGPPRCLG